MAKRVVLQHMAGRLAGLWRIVGTDEELKEIPTFVPEVNFGDHKAPCSLVTTRTRYHLYREVTPPEQP